ncbi:MAG: TolC family protein [Bacteroidaceae bacterium]|nr:TolC family protein [Bacteroidales bacterium]MBR0272566.1 TolC family protein [Bacteroidaceae bacterium]
MKHPKVTLCVVLISLFCSTLQAQTLTLDSCLALARRNNYEIRNSRLEVEKSQALKQQVFTKFFPQLSIRGLGYYAVNPLIHFSIDDIQSSDMRDLLQSLYEIVESESDIKKELDLMKTGASGSLVAVQPLFTGGRIVNGNKLANIGIEASQLQADMKERDVLEEIESSYYLVVGLQEKVSTVDAALSLIDSLERVVELAYTNGLVTRSDKLQIGLKRNEMLANKQKLSSGIRLSRRLLCQQVGIDYSDDLQFSDLQDEIQKPVLFLFSDRGDTLRPETRLLQLNIDAEQLRKKMTLGEAMPQLAIVGATFYGNIIKKEPTSNGIALLSLSIPITDWWETRHKVQQHDIAIDQARMMQEHYSKMMSLEEEKAYSDMMDAWTMIRSDSSALAMAQENYRLSTLNYQAGAATLAEVLQAQALLLQAHNALTDNRTAYIMARRRLTDLRHEQR